MNELGKNPEQDVIELLGKLRDAGPEYPAQLRSQRRAAVLASLAVVPVAATGLMAISWVARLVKLVKGMGLIDQIILGVEVAAITGLTASGAITAYVYRDAIRRLILPSSNTPFPTLSVPSTLVVGKTPGAVEGTPEGTETVTPTATPLATWTGAPTLPPFGVTSPPIVPTSVQPTNPPLATKPPKATPTKPGRRCGQDIICTPGPTKTPKP